jgi:hypothetical protein
MKVKSLIDDLYLTKAKQVLHTNWGHDIKEGIFPWKK